MKLTIGEVRKLIREVIKEENLLDEGFLDKVKNTGKAALIGLSLAGSAHANPVSDGNQLTTSSDSESDEDIITLQDNEGNDHKFRKIIQVIVRGKQYIALEKIESDELFLFRYIIDKQSGNERFIEIENNEIWEEVKAAVEEALNEDEDEDD